VNKKIVYEQALNDRIRNLLRLEFLFGNIMYRLKGLTEWDNRAVISGIIEILEFITRIDFITGLIKDLKQHTQILERWQHKADVDTEQLEKLLNQGKLLISKLEEIEGIVKERFSQHQLIHLVQQRSNIPGGTCHCDLPSYHYWLQTNPKQRLNELSQWLEPLKPLSEAVDLDLYLIRNNSILSQETAKIGLFKSKLTANVTYQLIQVIMWKGHPCYPEINGGKQRFSIRFFEHTQAYQRSKQTEQNVNFELSCCTI
jgi:cell division protein ZapD